MDITRLCLDTGPLIAFLKGREPGATAVERVLREAECFVTVITTYELLFGVARARRHIGEETLLANMTPLEIDTRSARRAAYLHDELLRTNQDIGIKDVLIAAICLEHELPLLTMNERHFQRVDGLIVLTPVDVLA